MFFRYVKMTVILTVIVMSLSMMSGCYFLNGVSSNEVGIILGDGVKVQQVVGPG